VKKGLKKFLSIAVKVGVLQTSKNDPQIVSLVDSRCIMETQLVKELYNQTVEQYSENLYKTISIRLQRKLHKNTVNITLL
jgi:ABC-type oligopeptide transport system ATPase subunit